MKPMKGIFFMKKVMLGVLSVLFVQSALAFTLEQAKGFKEQCRTNRNITFKYVTDTEIKGGRGKYNAIDLIENGRVIGHHYCSVEGRPSVIEIDGKSFSVSPNYCVSALKDYQTRYQQCLEVNSLLESESKPVTSSQLKAEGDTAVLEIKNLKLGQDKMWEIPLLSDGKEVASAFCPSRGSDPQLVIDGNNYSITGCDGIYKAAGKDLKIIVNQKSQSAQIVTESK
jgi:hypothetical protein